MSPKFEGGSDSFIMNGVRVSFLVLSKDNKPVVSKLEELELNGIRSVLVVCGERINLPNVVYREPNGKYDAVNFGASKLLDSCDVIVMNDVDTRISGLEYVLQHFSDPRVAMVFSRISVADGPQTTFYGLMDQLRRHFPVAANGELIAVRSDVLRRIIPLPPCLAEDTYIMFKVMEFGYKVVVEERSKVVTNRTKTKLEEEKYKRRTVLGIYQALSMSHPDARIRAFYWILPFVSLLLIAAGNKGLAWTKGIISGFALHLIRFKSFKW
jgi:cellulose synthase/poly-beta-1,6-N-acetylglucosamine synthase-like glycosyltransferase